MILSKCKAPVLWKGFTVEVILKVQSNCRMGNKMRKKLSAIQDESVGYNKHQYETAN